MKPRPKPPFRPGVLVVKEKHETLYFNVPDEQTLHALALEILTRRFEHGRFYYKPPVPDALQITRTEIEGRLPAGRVRDAALQEFDRQVDFANSEAHFRAEYDRIEKAVGSKEGKLAWRSLQDRNDYAEYENVKFVPFEITGYKC